MRLLNIAQPSPKEEDVFPAVYLMNSFGALLKCLPSDCFEHFSYSWDSEPGYHANNKILYRSMQIIHYTGCIALNAYGIYQETAVNKSAF